MLAYRAEIRMMPALLGAPWKQPNARKLLRTLFTSDAVILPDPGAVILRVRFLGFHSRACERALAPLIEELNATRTVFPGPSPHLGQRNGRPNRVNRGHTNRIRSGNLKLRK